MPTTDLALFRSVRKEDFTEGVIVDDHAVGGVLYPSFEEKVIETGSGRNAKTTVRKADVTPYRHRDEEVVDPGGGTSLFDRENVFGPKYWLYFTIPRGTVIPESLRIRHTGRNDRYSAEHYQIEASARYMPVTAYKGALDNLARNAVEKLYRDARRPAGSTGD